MIELGRGVNITDPRGSANWSGFTDMINPHTKGKVFIVLSDGKIYPEGYGGEPRGNSSDYLCQRAVYVNRRTIRLDSELQHCNIGVLADWDCENHCWRE